MKRIISILSSPAPVITIGGGLLIGGNIAGNTGAIIGAIIGVIAGALAAMRRQS
jgi:energy-converting hydrogenase Eha subunit A